MKRATVGSLLFVGGALFVFLAPASEGSAKADGVRPVATTVAADIGAMDVGAAPSDAAPSRAAPSDAAELAVSAPAEVTPANAGLKAMAAPELPSSGDCPEGMVEVEGDYCPVLEQNCVKWMDPEGTIPRRCTEFAKTGNCHTKTIKKHFCIDRFEYPNKLGEKPVVMKTWYEAGDACKAQGKRLCGDSEWTLACEGQERLPYPYGYERNAEACNIDKPHPDVNENALANPKTRAAEVERLWQGETSGSRESCVSPYGAFDMTGNVDEWVVNEGGMPYKSGLKGGYWGPVRDRCRPMTTAHNEGFAFYQIGFRCCSDAPSDGAGVGGLKAPAQPGIGAPGGKVPNPNPPPSGPLTGS
jgi:hypothetical protein